MVGMSGIGGRPKHGFTLEDLPNHVVAVPFLFAFRGFPPAPLGAARIGQCPHASRLESDNVGIIGGPIFGILR